MGARHESARRPAFPNPPLGQPGGVQMNGRVVAFVCRVAALAAFLRPAGAVPTEQALHGLAPMPDNRGVPGAWLPPGAPSPDSGPSAVVFPPQKLTIRFNHKKHLKEAGA